MPKFFSVSLFFFRSQSNKRIHENITRYLHLPNLANSRGQVKTVTESFLGMKHLEETRQQETFSNSWWKRIDGENHSHAFTRMTSPLRSFRSPLLWPTTYLREIFHCPVAQWWLYLEVHLKGWGLKKWKLRNVSLLANWRNWPCGDFLFYFCISTLLISRFPLCFLFKMLQNSTIYESSLVIESGLPYRHSFSFLWHNSWSVVRQDVSGSFFHHLNFTSIGERTSTLSRFGLMLLLTSESGEDRFQGFVISVSPQTLTL